MKKNKGKWLTVIMIILDVLLIGALFFVFGKENEREARSMRILKKAVSAVQAEMNDSGGLNGADSAEEIAGMTPAPIPSVLSIRGDSYTIPGGDPQTDYPAILQQLLADAGSTIRVMDYTLDQKSVLTHLYYAGVPASEINSYIEKNSASEETADNPLETGVGDVKNLSLARNDADAIPIIFAGYYGGWGKDVFELIDMEKDILSTYNQSDYYIIVGNHPANVLDVDTYDKIMSGYWGSHYLGVTKIAGSSLTTLEGHQKLAERILTKLEQLGYFVPEVTEDVLLTAG